MSNNKNDIIREKVAFLSFVDVKTEDDFDLLMKELKKDWKSTEESHKARLVEFVMADTNQGSKAKYNIWGTRPETDEEKGLRKEIEKEQKEKSKKYALTSIKALIDSSQITGEELLDLLTVEEEHEVVVEVDETS